MSGFNSSAPGSSVASEPLSFTVHSMPAPDVSDAARRTAVGRLKMLAVLAVCAAPVIASYLTYFVIRPESRNNYSELITPPRVLPDTLPLKQLSGADMKPAGLRGQWLIVVVSDAACDATCEKSLYLQRQLREALGGEKDRVDKVWFITDDGVPRPAVLQAIAQGAPATVLRAPRADLAQWLAPARGHTLAEHLFVVDPMGQWMMRAPADPDPTKLKRDIERLLRASASWDRPGR
ncbi:SCO family protein [Piscinibacter sp.]|uniref:SCO family protein n=1 Tax=Piscinibacter sp. TaxID=1903157 RepID=UPI003559F9DD